MAENKTEKATPRRKEKAREKGQIARSRELSSAIAVMAAICFLYWRNAGWVQQWRDLFDNLLKTATHTDIQTGSSVLALTGLITLKWTGPVCLVGFAIGVLTQVAQGGFVFSAEALALKPERLNPAGNMKQLFSLTGTSRLLKSLVPLTVIIFLGITVVEARWSSIIHASVAGTSALPGMLMQHSFEIAWKGAFVFMVWSIVDYALQHRKFESDLKMSKQEVRDENRESEGHPTIRGQIRRLQRQMRKRRMMKDVEKATVIVTNPTHFAIALRYEIGTMEAPVVVAKGRDLLAQKIKQIAQWHGIPAVENRPLAQALYRAVDVGSVIPSKLYTAVAEILAFVFRAQAQAAQRSGGRA